MPTTTISSPTDVPSLPQPTGKALPFDQLRTYQQTIDYALSGFHASIKQGQKAEGARARLWQDAAAAYRTAYLTILPLKSLPEEQGFPQAKDLLKQANHLADEATASARS